MGGIAFSQSALAKGGQEKVTICHVDQETGEEKSDDGNDEPRDGCHECQAATGTGNTLVGACDCVGGITVFPNVCIETFCSIVTLQPVCGPFCLAATGDSTLIGAACFSSTFCPAN